MDPIGLFNLLEGPGEQIVFLPFKNVLFSLFTLFHAISESFEIPQGFWKGIMY